MKKFKRIIALITVAMFLLSVAAPSAFAATKEDAFGRLNALGVAYGDQNGDPMYDKSFTRAEAAAIMVNLLGMKAAIDSAKGATKFKDVPASHWASGVINLAVGAGVIKGYPDGSYKPDKEVTYAEMSAMLVQVLGYGPKLEGPWPTNVIGKAAQLGLLDGISVNDFNAAAVRSNVFLAADKATNVKPLKEDRLGYVEDTKTLMEAKLNVAKQTEGTVINVPNYGNDKKKVTIDPDLSKGGDDFTVTVADNVDPNANWGEKVVSWVKDDKVFFFDVKTDSSSIIKDELDANYIAASDEVDLKNKDKKYTFAVGAKIYRNYVDVSANKAALLKNDKVKVVLDANGKIAYMEAWAYSQALVDEVKTTDEKIVFKTPAGSLELKNDVVTIVKNGKIASLADVKAGDVLDYVENAAKTTTYVFANSNVKTGKLTAVAQGSSNFTLTVGGESVKSLNLTIVLSENDGKDYNKTLTTADDFKPYFNKDVTVKLNNDGKAVYIVVASTGTASEFPVLVRDIASDAGLDKNTYIKAGKFDGTNVNYQVTKNTKINSEDINDTKIGIDSPQVIAKDGLPEILEGTATEVVKIALTSDGKVDYVKLYTTELVSDGDGSMAVSKENDTIAINGTAYKVTADTKIIKKKANGEVASLTWAGIESLVNAEGNFVLAGADKLKAVTDAGKVTFMVVLEDVTTTTDYKYGVIASRGSNAELGSFTEVDINGTYTKYKGTVDAVAYPDRTLIQFKVDAENNINSVTGVSAATVTGATYSTYVVKDVNKTDKVLTIVEWDGTAELSTKYYPIYDTNVQLYSVKDNVLKDMKIEDLAVGDKIKLYDDLNTKGEADIADGAYDFIIKQ